MTDKQNLSNTPLACLPREGVDLSNVHVVMLHPEPTLGDYRAALSLADSVAEQRLGDYMLLSWYDKNRDFESPQHVSECHLDSDIPGYVDYGISHGATLMVDVDGGRFVFFYLAID
jgi:hypothetical protein